MLTELRMFLRKKMKHHLKKEGPWPDGSMVVSTFYNSSSLVLVVLPQPKKMPCVRVILHPANDKKHAKTTACMGERTDTPGRNGAQHALYAVVEYSGGAEQGSRASQQQSAGVDGWQKRFSNLFLFFWPSSIIARPILHYIQLL